MALEAMTSKKGDERNRIMWTERWWEERISGRWYYREDRGWREQKKYEFESTSLPTVSWEVICLSLRDVSQRAIGGRDRCFRLLALLAVSILLHS